MKQVCKRAPDWLTGVGAAVGLGVGACQGVRLDDGARTCGAGRNSIGARQNMALRGSAS